MTNIKVKKANKLKNFVADDMKIGDFFMLLSDIDEEEPDLYVRISNMISRKKRDGALSKNSDPECIQTFCIQGKWVEYIELDEKVIPIPNITFVIGDNK